MPTYDLASLQLKNIYLIDGWHRNEPVLFADDFVNEVLSWPIFRKKLAPCVIDLAKVRAGQKVILNKDLLVLSSRVKIFGTDGIRGVISLDRPSPGRSFLQMFSRENKLTPDLVRQTAYSFGRSVIIFGKAAQGDYVLIGEDGRDYMKGKPFRSALKNGLLAAGLNVADAGVIPTPGIPIVMAAKNYKAAAVLTASHNPSNQNGVKFFVDGYKVLPEGNFGDFAITARVYAQLFEGKKVKAASIVKDVSKEAESLYREVTGRSVPFSTGLAGVNLVFDPANGAGTYFGKDIFRALGIKARCVNDEPKGENINQGGGVALLEGVEKFLPEDIESHPSAIREMMEKKVRYGIVLDGDGDRCYLLIRSDFNNTVDVLNGDKLSFLLARFLRKTSPAGGLFINTVESDIMTALSAGRELKIKTRLACVGDKWVVNALLPGDRLLVGAEESGHIIMPVKVKGKTVYCGNGLLTGLAALSIIKQYDCLTREIVSPYDEGFKKTFYTYLVDKTLFQRGSRAFDIDRELALEVFSRLRKETGFEGSMEEKIFADDPDMLYMAVNSGNDMVGAVFARNSGTETKTSVNVRSMPELSGMFSSIAARLVENHRMSLKDDKNPDTARERKVLLMLAKTRVLELSGIRKELDIDGPHLKALLYGMSKEYPEYKEKLMRLLS